MVFGVFDGLHEGHKQFLSFAKNQGDILIVVIAPDSIVEQLKDRLPTHNEGHRRNEILKIEDVDVAVIGDNKLSSYNVVKKYRPNIVVYGHDQDRLKKDIQKNRTLFDFKLTTIKAKGYKSHIYKSSLLQKRRTHA